MRNERIIQEQSRRENLGPREFLHKIRREHDGAPGTGVLTIILEMAQILGRNSCSAEENCARILTKNLDFSTCETRLAALSGKIEKFWIFGKNHELIIQVFLQFSIFFRKCPFSG